MLASGLLRKPTPSWCAFLFLYSLCNSPLLLQATARNPNSLTAGPSTITMPDTIRFCAGGGANMTVDVKYY